MLVPCLNVQRISISADRIVVRLSSGWIAMVTSMVCRTIISWRYHANIARHHVVPTVVVVVAPSPIIHQCPHRCSKPSRCLAAPSPHSAKTAAWTTSLWWIQYSTCSVLRCRKMAAAVPVQPRCLISRMVIITKPRPSMALARFYAAAAHPLRQVLVDLVYKLVRWLLIMCWVNYWKQNHRIFITFRIFDRMSRIVISIYERKL